MSEEKKEYKLTYFQKAALSGFVAFMNKTGIKAVIIRPDHNDPNGLSTDFFIKDIKVLTIEEFDNFRNMIDL